MRMHAQPRSVIPAVVAVLIIASLAALVVKRRVARIRDGFLAHQMLEDLGHLDNELRWITSELDQMSRSPSLLIQAEKVGLTVERGPDVVVIAPRAGKEVGQ